MKKLLILILCSFFVGCAGMEFKDVKFKGPITNNDYEVGELKIPEKEAPDAE